jgi:cardiolipin synthase
VFVLLAWMDLLPAWLVVLALLREALILSGIAAYRVLIGPFAGEPTPASKVNTFLQITLVIAVLLVAAGVVLPAGLVAGLELAVAASVVVSGGQYVWLWSRRYRGLRTQRP